MGNPIDPKMCIHFDAIAILQSLSMHAMLVVCIVLCTRRCYGIAVTFAFENRPTRSRHEKKEGLWNFFCFIKKLLYLPFLHAYMHHLVMLEMLKKLEKPYFVKNIISHKDDNMLK